MLNDKALLISLSKNNNNEPITNEFVITYNQNITDVESAYWGWGSEDEYGFGEINPAIPYWNDHSGKYPDLKIYLKNLSFIKGLGTVIMLGKSQSVTPHQFGITFTCKEENKRMVILTTISSIKTSSDIFNFRGGDGVRTFTMSPPPRWLD